MGNFESLTPNFEQDESGTVHPDNSDESIEKQNPAQSEYLDVEDFLGSFRNEISPMAIGSVEKRPDNAIVMHCNNLYEYLMFAYQEDPEQIERIEKHRAIFEAFSKPDSISQAMRDSEKLSREEQEWIMGKLNAEGSAVPVEFGDGETKSVVIMNDMPTRRLYNRDGTKREAAQLERYDREYERTVEHEVRHSQYYDRYGKDLEDWRETMEKRRHLSPVEQREYHYNRYMKDEIAAHIENEVTEENGNIRVNWDRIVENLQNNDYRFPAVFRSSSDKEEYLNMAIALVNTAKEYYQKGKSSLEIMDILDRVDVKEMMGNS